MSNSPFLSSISHAMRQKGYALKTEKTYLDWIKRFILFHNKQHQKNMGANEVRAFLSSLANQHHVAIGTQKIALNALAFLYNKYLNQPLGQLDFIPASRPRRLPVVLSISEVKNILNAVDNSRNHIVFPCFMERVCVLMNAYACELRTLILTIEALVCMTAKEISAE